MCDSMIQSAGFRVFHAIDIIKQFKYNGSMEQVLGLDNPAAAADTGKDKDMAETNIAQSVDAVNAAASYDANIKFLLADKQVLARILKYAVREFGDMELEDIMAGIGSDIEVGTKPVDAGLSNTGRISGANTEDNIPGEGKIFYDIRFTAYLGMRCHGKREIKFLVNVEAQKSTDPNKLGYHLENRILFYLARMISAQKQTEFYHSDYDSLKPVRSIWICLDGSEDGDCIEEINLDRRTVFGAKTGAYSMDLMRGIIIRVRTGENIKRSRNMLIAMLESLLSRMGVEEKKRILASEYGMVMTMELEGRMRTMCNLSQVIEERSMERGMERGLEQGIKQGIQQGVQKERLNAVKRMLKAGATKEQIVSYGYTEEELIHAEDSLYVSV